ncbi:MAG: hypothetical protein C4523_08935 [Myxococcales bacterium]|nr:MAG: hypothetical protein C4523_08935 [Myxococcales bacterium]
MAIHGIVCAKDYMDEDVAYLLGMLYGNGELAEQGTTRRIVITLAIRQRNPIKDIADMDVAAMNERSLNVVRRRINELLDANVDVETESPTKARLTAVFTRKTMAWRNLLCLCSRGTSRGTFRLPKAFFAMDRIYHEEFVRGFADAAVTPNLGDRLPGGGPHRIAFPVVYRNKRFANQLHKLLVQLDVTDEDVGLLSGSGKVRGGTDREHRIRVYAERFVAIGFSFEHKQKMLEWMAQKNRELSADAT